MLRFFLALLKVPHDIAVFICEIIFNELPEKIFQNSVLDISLMT